jgi:ERCC4-type nuclease
VDAQVKKLDFGDFLLAPYTRSTTVGVERKTVKDLVHTVEDKRFKRQMSGLRDAYDAGYLLVEGEFCWAKSDGATHLLLPGRGLTRWTFAGVMNTIAAAQLPDQEGRRLGYQHTLSLKESILWLIAFYKMLSKPQEEGQPTIRKVRTRRTDPPGLAPLAQVVGPKTARALLNRFNTIAAIVASPDSEVSAVSGVGPATVRAIRREFNGLA